MTGHELLELLDSIDTDDPSNFGAIFRTLMFEAKPALERGDLDTASAAMESAAIVALAFDRAHNAQDPAMDEDGGTSLSNPILKPPNPFERGH